MTVQSIVGPISDCLLYICDLVFISPPLALILHCMSVCLSVCVPHFRLKDDSLDCVKIADFGLSQFYRPGVLIKCDGSGTLSISAPELLIKPIFDSEENTHATYNFGNGYFDLFNSLQLH